MPSRIAFCITSLDTGGAERQFVELVARLPRERFEPAVVALAPMPAPPHDELVKQLREHSVPVTFLNARHFWQTPFVLRGLTRWLRDERPALLQCFLAHANVLGAYAALRTGVRPIVTGIRVAEQRRNWHLALQRQIARFVDRQVCVSQSVAEFANHAMRLPREQLVVIPNGIDLEKFSHTKPISLGELGVPPARRLILYVARLEPDKRPHWLLDRVPEIARRLPQHDLVVAGRGPLGAALERRAAQLGVAERVHFVGWRADVPRLLASADLLVLTSSSEGMPNVILEAMASARAVVATEVHGALELLGGDHGGQITPANDPQAFVDAVRRIGSDDNWARQLGQRNRSRARELFSFDRTVGSYATLYDSLLAAKIR